MRNFRRNSLDWVPGARAGSGLVIRHPAGVVVGASVSLGHGVTLMQGVTLGRRHAVATEGDGDPEVSDDVVIGASAVVLGPIVVGQGARVGALAVVLKDVLPFTTVVGAPARAV